MIWVHDLSPIALNLGVIQLHWYGIAYLAGFVCGLYYFKWLAAKYPVAGLTKKHVDDLFVWIILGIVLGGRLGFVLFYAPAYYLQNPLDALMIWQGGMSFHGGLLGVAIALWGFAKKHGLKVFDLTDRIPTCVTFGLFFGRLANFVNGELWGKPTDGTWGVVFPNTDFIPRHPSQLYEAALEGALMFLILHLVTLKFGIKRHLLPALFLILYGSFRFCIEFVRIGDPSPFAFLTMGQLLSLPMIVAGVGLWIYGLKTKVN